MDYRTLVAHDDIVALNTHNYHGPEISPLLLQAMGLSSDELKAVREKSHQPYLIRHFKDIPFPATKSPKFSFIDLFAGVGGFRLALQQLDGQCVFTSEIDSYAKSTYCTNFGELPFGDIRNIPAAYIPDHDILCAGFPCQAFSIAGYRQGFDDAKGRGNLFFEIERIIHEKRPRAYILENVKNLEGHDKGNTFKEIKKRLLNLGYSVFHRVLNTMEYSNIPQNRERIFIVGYRDEADWRNKESSFSAAFRWPEKRPLTKHIRDVLLHDVHDRYYYKKYACYPDLVKGITSLDTVYQWRRMYVRENKKGVCPTLTANMGTGGHNVPLVLDGLPENPKRGNIRKLTPRECARLQGFPDHFKLPDLSLGRLYKQFGNSVTVPVVARVAKSLLAPFE